MPDKKPELSAATSKDSGRKVFKKIQLLEQNLLLLFQVQKEGLESQLLQLIFQ